MLALLAEAQMKAQQHEDAAQSLDRALEMASRNGELFYEAELWRLKGELLLQQAEKLRD
jgi:hypothetical protein